MNLFLIPAIFFPIFYLFSISNVKSLQTVQQLEDEAMVAFAKGRTLFDKFCATHWLTIDRYNDNLAQKYETFLGVLYFIKTNWQCEKVVDKLVKKETNSDDEMNDVKECGNYRKHVIILYKDLFREYARQSVKAADPGLAEQIPIEEKQIVKFAYYERGWGVLYRNAGTLIDLIQSLCQIWRFFFDQSYRRTFKSKSDCWLAYHRIQKPNFVNQESLVKKYGVELDNFNRTEFLYNTKNLKISANSNFDNSYLRNRKVFDEKLAKLLKKVETNAKRSLTESKGVIEHLLEMPFYHILQAINDNAFLTFVKDKNKFENLCNKFGPNYLLKYATVKLAKQNGQLTFEETKKYLAKHFEAFLRIMSLVGEKWKCDNSEFDLDECVKFRKYFDILHEYLLQEYIDGAQNSKEMRQFSVIRPNFQLVSEIKLPQ